MCFFQIQIQRIFRYLVSFFFFVSFLKFTSTVLWFDTIIFILLRKIILLSSKCDLMARTDSLDSQFSYFMFC